MHEQKDLTIKEITLAINTKVYFNEYSECYYSKNFNFELIEQDKVGVIIDEMRLMKAFIEDQDLDAKFRRFKMELMQDPINPTPRLK